LASPKGIDLLCRLGLTLRQAKVYLCLVEYGPSSVKEISRCSHAPREDLYRILSKLNNIGLVEKRITFPVTFGAAPIPDALSFLHARRIRETSELQEEQRDFLEMYMTKLASKIQSKEQPNFVLIPHKQAGIAKRKKAVARAEHTVDVVTSYLRALHAIENLAEEIDNALKRGVKFRLLTHLPEETKAPITLKDMNNKTGFQVEYIRSPPSAQISIYDKKEVLIDTEEDAERLGTSPVLWSDNKILVKLSQIYFDTLKPKGSFYHVLTDVI
jgi:sugar-specific transcriptional regulator TrmB